MINFIYIIILFFVTNNVLSQQIHRGSQSNSSFYGNSNISGIIRWQISVSDKTINASPIVYNDNLYTVTAEQKIISINKKTGNINWQNKLSSKVTSQISIHDKSLIIGTEDGAIYFIDINDGSMIHKITTNGALRGRVITNNNNIFFTNETGKTCIINSNLEIEIECLPAKNQIVPPMLYDSKIITTERNSCCHLNFSAYNTKKDDIENNISVKFNKEFIFMPIVVNNAIYGSGWGAENRPTNLYSIDLKNGNVNEIFKIDIVAYLSATDDNIIFGDHQNFYSIDLAGNINWTYETNNPAVTYPSLSTDSAYFANENKIHSVDAETGELKWVIEGDFKISTPMTLDESGLYFGTRDGRIIAIN